MRIISGKLQGRKFYPPKNIYIRPTMDKAKESLFNVLSNFGNLENKILVLDMFSGTGSISYEFISHGAFMVSSVDVNCLCTKYIKETSKKFKIYNKMQIYCENAFHYLNKNIPTFNIIFADPPYHIDNRNLELLFQLVLKKNGCLKKNGLIILEHSAKKNSFVMRLPYFRDTKKSGDTYFSFFKIIK
jgi:16S rRNA (guanine966-N2)-methyltransferase